jgi:hypothetical protein
MRRLATIAFFNTQVKADKPASKKDQKTQSQFKIKSKTTRQYSSKR